MPSKSTRYEYEALLYHRDIMEGLKRKAIVSLVSSYAAQFTTVAANLATKLILARLIAPEDLGLYALTLLIMLGGDMLIDLGVSQHIVRERDRPYGNLLVLRIVISAALFAGLELGAPILKFWGAEFPGLVRLMAFTLVIKGFSGVPNLFLDRELLIHRSLLPQFARIASMGLVSVGLAYFGYGVWALVWGTVAAEAVFGLLIWRAARGHIPLILTWRHTWELVWGSKYLFLISIMGFALQQGDVAIIGGLLSAKEVGFYAMAFTLIILVSKVVEAAVFRVIYPMFCEYRHDMEKMGRTYRFATLAITAIEAPIYFYLLFNSPIIVPLILGEKWLPSALLMQALAIFGILNPFSTFGNEILRATKRDAILTVSTVIGAITLLTTGYMLTSRFGTLGTVAAHYIIIGSIPTIITIYRTVTADFIKLTRQLAIVYATSFSVIAIASIGLSFNPYIQAFATGLLVPACWYTYYRVFGNGIGRDALNVILDRRSTAVTEAAG